MTRIWNVTYPKKLIFVIYVQVKYTNKWSGHHPQTLVHCVCFMWILRILYLKLPRNFCLLFWSTFSMDWMESYSAWRGNARTYSQYCHGRYWFKSWDVSLELFDQSTMPSLAFVTRHLLCLNQYLLPKIKEILKAWELIFFIDFMCLFSKIQQGK